MDEHIKEVIDNFLFNFKNLDAVKKYLLYKNILKKDETFLELKNKKKEAQKALAVSLNSPYYEDKKREYLILEEEYNNYPIYLNYLNYEQEVKALLKEIEISLK